MTSITQGQQAAALISATRALDARTLRIEQTLDSAALSWRPPNGGWSIGTVFEHLCVANDSYLEVLRRLVANAPRGTGSHEALPWKRSFAGRLLVHSFKSSRKMSAPKIYRPSPEPRPNVIGEFLERQRELVSLIERSMTLEWQRIRMASPVTRIIRMNIGDAFDVLVTHAERHFQQIDRIRAEYESEMARRGRAELQAAASP